MEPQAGFGFDAGAPDQERLREFDADFTPAPIVAQLLSWLAPRISPRTILDPSAGSGVFGQECRRVWPSASIWAVEPRREEHQNLLRHYDAVHIRNFDPMECFSGVDLITTNPPFTLFPQFIEHAHTLQSSGTLALLGLSTWGQSAEGVDLFTEFTPRWQLRIGGRIGYRGPGLNPKTGKPWGVDQRDYSWWIWEVCKPGLRSNEMPSWTTIQLPVLSASERTWRIRPGTGDR